MRPTEPAEEPAHDILTDIPTDIPGAALPAFLEPLPYPRRMRALALLARRLAGTSRVRVLLGELSAGDRDARRTALHVAMAARDLGFVQDVLAGPDMGLRRAALRAVRTLPVPDAAVAAALQDAPADLRLALYRTLAHARRQTLAESLLPHVHARWGDREAAALLPACGATTAGQWLPRVAHAVTSWTALAERHADAVMAVAEQELSSGADAWTWWRRRGAGVARASLREPARLLALLERRDLRPFVVRLPVTALNALFGVDVARATRVVADAWSSCGSAPPKALLRRLRSVPDAEIMRLAHADRGLGPVLRWLPPARRVVIFEAVAGKRGGSTGMWALDVLGWLPAGPAAAEARHMLAWYESVWHSARARLDDPNIPLRLTSFLPYEEAAGPLREAAVGGDPRRRGLARTLLVRCAVRAGDRAELHALLADLAARTVNEQDPLRRDLLTALREVPPGLFDDSCAGTLDRIATDALEAPDSSLATAEALHGLAGRTLRHHDPGVAPALTAWALGVYGGLVARHGADGLPGRVSRTVPAGRRRYASDTPAVPEPLDRVLRAGQEHDLLALLRPHLRAARERGDFALAVALAHALGRRSWALAELLDDLRAAVRLAPEPLAREAAGLWLTRPHHRRRTLQPVRAPGPERPPGGGRPPYATGGERERRVAELVREDPSTVVLPAVWRTVARRRTDLLPPLLESDRGGRFAGSAWVPPVSAGDAGRWTPGQLDRVRAVLAEAVHDEGLPIALRVAAVRATGRISGGLDLLAAWARREEVVLAEAAIAAMADADAPGRAVRLLLEHAGGRASRVAVAALARRCGAVPPSLLGPLLEKALTAPDSKVVLRKQAIRRLGRDRPPGAADVLLRAWADPGLHRDVRVAVASVLRGMPEDARALDALGDAAGRHAGEPMLRELLAAHPLEYAPDVRPRYADLVRRLLLAADLPGVRFRASKAFALWAHWYRGGLEEIIEAAADPGSGEQAMEVFLALLRAGTIRSQALDVLSRLAAAVPGESLRTPARARVAGLVEELARVQDLNVVAEPWRRRLARDAVDLLAGRPLLLTQAVRLAVALLPADEEGESPSFGDELCALADLLHDRPVLAARTAVRVVSEVFGRYRRRWPMPTAAVPVVARRLMDRGDLAGALFALALTRVCGERAEWAAPWEELLHDLRSSPHLEVRQDAWDTFPG
ncbi:hypothetical protein [Nonomuraea sp. NPDC005501]|uniref:hypothetical protein n=1 Tax=Nonomuraea sp. NPDC005501 TaxID=3156884 RepID=UPI0033AE9634